jgi:hypothetical protein
LGPLPGNASLPIWQRDPNQEFYCAPHARLSAACQGLIKVRDNSPAPTFTAMHRRHHAITLQQASEESPTLAQLMSLTRESSARLQAIQPLLPPALRSAIQAGPIEGPSWCLLVKGNAAAAKLRQLAPALAAHLRSKGWDVQGIRLKVQ